MRSCTRIAALASPFPHFELLRAFTDDAVLDQISAALVEYGYHAHEFGDSMLIERQARAPRQ
jgi:hypothetical protein